MEMKKVWSSLCYFSIFFAAFLFPFIVFLATDDPDTKQHAKKALLSHLIPFIAIPFLVISIYMDRGWFAQGIPVYTVVCIILSILLSICVTIWNIVKGIKVLK